MAYKCNYDHCDKEYKYKRGLTRHIKLHINNINNIYNNLEYKCDYLNCFYKFKSYYCLVKHNKESHNIILNFKCNNCNKEYKTQSGLTKHLLTHNKKEFKCNFPNCIFESYNLVYLKNHLKVHDNINIKEYKCNYDNCYKEYKTQSGLNYHILINHNNTKNKYKCEQCIYSTKNKQSLKQHIKKHENKKEFKCDFLNCTYRGNILANLKRHKERHLSNIKYKCEFKTCSYETKDKESLIKHKIIHDENTFFTCIYENCDYKCNFKMNLRYHIEVIHLPYIAHKCEYDYCEFETNCKKNLNRHLKTIHSEKGQLRQKKQEFRVEKKLDYYNINYKREHVIKFQCLTSSNKFAKIDFLILKNNSVIFLEVDENQHKFGYGNASCDLKRMMLVSEALAYEGNTLKVLWLRYNPNCYKINNIKQNIIKEEREDKLIKFINNWKPKNDFELKYMYYDLNENNNLVLFDDPEYDEYIKTLVI